LLILGIIEKVIGDRTKAYLLMGNDAPENFWNYIYAD
jgi:hypothetical protein